MIINRNKRLSPAGMKLVLGIPFTRVECTGTINGTNTDFILPRKYYPIYPANHKDIIAKTSDVTAELYKAGEPATYTSAAVTAIKTVTDSISNQTVDAGVTLTTAPEVATTDKVYLSGHSACWLRIAQDLSPTIDRDSEEIAEIGTDDKIKSYGARTREYKVEVIMALDTLILLTEIQSEEKADQTGVASGKTLRTERDIPLQLKGYIPVVYDGEEVLRWLLTSIQFEEGLPEIKAGESKASTTVTLSVGDAIETLTDDTIFAQTS